MNSRSVEGRSETPIQENPQPVRGYSPETLHPVSSTLPFGVVGSGAGVELRQEVAFSFKFLNQLTIDLSVIFRTEASR